MDIGHWASGDLRKISEETQLKELRTTNIILGHQLMPMACGEPSEKPHSKSAATPSTDYIAIPKGSRYRTASTTQQSLVDEILEHIDNEYPSFPHRLTDAN